MIKSIRCLCGQTETINVPVLPTAPTLWQCPTCKLTWEVRSDSALVLIPEKS